MYELGTNWVRAFQVGGCQTHFEWCQGGESVAGKIKRESYGNYKKCNAEAEQEGQTK